MTLFPQQKIIGLITILSGLLALGCVIAGMIGVDNNFDAFSNPLLILTMPGTNAEATRWSMVFDMFGYYMLLLPVIYLLHDWMKTQSAWSSFITFNGLAYVLIGTIGAAILATIWPPIIAHYAHVSPEQQQLLRSNFQLVNDLVYGGLWNLLEMFFAGAWWFFAGLILHRRFRFIGKLGISLGIFCFADGLAGIFQVSWLHELALNVYLFLSIIWAITIGVFLLKKPIGEYRN